MRASHYLEGLTIPLHLKLRFTRLEETFAESILPPRPKILSHEPQNRGRSLNLTIKLYRNGAIPLRDAGRGVSKLLTVVFSFNLVFKHATRRERTTTLLHSKGSMVAMGFLQFLLSHNIPPNGSHSGAFVLKPVNDSLATCLLCNAKVVS